MKRFVPSILLSSILLATAINANEIKLNLSDISEIQNVEKKIKVSNQNIIDISDIDNSNEIKEKKLEKYPKWAQKKKSIKTSMITLYDLLDEVIPEKIFVKIDKEIFVNYSSLVIPSFKANNQSIGEILERVSDSFDVFVKLDKSKVEVKLVDTKTFQLPLASSLETSTNVKIGASAAEGGSNRNISSTTEITNESFDIIKENLDSYITSSIERTGIYHYYLINKDTGIITVRGTKNTLEKISAYIEEVIEANTKVILLEAKIIKFANNDSQAYGIQWNRVFESLSMQGAGSMAINMFKPSIGDTSSSLDMATSFSGGTETALINLGNNANPYRVIKALDTLGSIETVSEPTIRVSNNQSTTIFSGKVTNYIAEINSETDENGNTSTTLSPKQIEEGFNMTIKARIKKETNEIELFMVPVLNNLLALKSASVDGNEIRLPIIDNRSMNITTKIKNGETLILAGLKEKAKNKTNSGVPILSKIPVIKNMFGYNEKIKSENELVIIIKAQILE